MKNIVLVLICILMLMGCEKNGEEYIEYTVDEFSSVYWQISEYDSNQFSKLTKEEQYGGYESKDEMTKFANPIHVEFQLEKMKELGFSYNESVIIRGRLDRAIGDDDIQTYLLKPLENNYDILPIHIRMDEGDSSLEEGDIVLVQAEFLEELAGTAVIMGNGKILSK